MEREEGAAGAGAKEAWLPGGGLAIEGPALGGGIKAVIVSAPPLPPPVSHRCLPAAETRQRQVGKGASAVRPIGISSPGHTQDRQRWRVK